MLYVFYILVFLNINYAEINCFALKQYDPGKGVNVTNTTKITIEPDHIIRNNTTTRHFFKMIQNLTSTKSNFSNLKSNVFDKMLSDEMLSIKEHLFEKDLSQVSLLLSTNANAPTPTLEIKQKWPFVEYEPLDTIKNDINNESKINDKTSNETDNGQNQNKKIVGLRSLSLETHPHESYQRPRLRHYPKNESSTTKGVNSCTCIGMSNSVMCSHRSDSSCKCGNNDPKACTRLFQTFYPTAPLAVSVPMFSYVTYPTYLLEISTISPYRDYYYHPNVVDDVKLPKNRKKHKHRHKTTRRIDEESLYYDEVKQGFFKDDLKYDDELHNEKTKNPLTFNPADNQIIIDIDYEVRDEKGQIPKTTLNWGNGQLKNVNKEKLVNDMVKDLRQQYADAVLRECYCSALSLHKNITLHCVLSVLTLFWILHNLCQ